VLMTCHNRKTKTIRSLRALFGQKGINEQYSLTIFLVDDGSSDGTSNAIMEEFPAVNIITGDGSLYWNRGMHLAWSEAAKEDFDFYAWLNDDTFLFPTALPELLEDAKATNGRSIICGAACSEVTGLLTYGGMVKKDELLEPNGRLQKCDYFTGNFVLISRDIYKITGNLDYSFIHTIGDYDYGLRAGKAGIISYVSRFYVGTCERHKTLSDWCSPSVKLRDRLKAFKTPLAVNPVEYFKFDYRHKSLFSAVLHFISIHVRLFFPFLWNRKY